MASSSSSAEAPPPVQAIINILHELLDSLKESITGSEPINAHSATDSDGVCSCWSTNQAQPNSSPNDLELFNRLEMLERRDIKYTQHVLKDLEQKAIFDETLKQHLDILKQIQQAGPVPDVTSLEKTLTGLRQQIQSLQKAADTHGSDADETVAGTTFDAYYLVGEKQSKDMKDKMQKSSAFLDFYEDFLEVFKRLQIKTKLCLLCFSVFPEKAVVKKRALVQWWIGEGFVDSNSDATGILQDIVAKRFIEPELENRRLVGFKMDPLVRLVVVRIAEECRFLSFDTMGVPADDISWSHRACLVVRGKESSRAKLTSRGHPEKNGKHPEKNGTHEEELHRGHTEKNGKTAEKNGTHEEKLHTLFNVNDPYPDFKKDWFSKLKNLNVLCLGGWQGSAGQHIEIEDTEFLDELENMKYLKFVSLQGISRVTELPHSICKLKNLLILDLKACHNLEALPKNIGALKSLTHLDVSECYLLDHIPEGIASLSKLQVLKGFLVGQSTSKRSCGLEALVALTVLRKLSINTTRQDFPTEKEVQVLQRLKSLEKLNMTWRGKPSKAQSGKSSGPERASLNSLYDGVMKRCIDGIRAKQEDSSAQPPASAQSAGQPALDPQPCEESTPTGGTPAPAASTNPGEFKNLQKLELQCFPKTTPPAWLIKGKLKPEKKLYISGGNLQSLHQFHGKGTSWEVQILRLRYLKQLTTNWSELKKSFPGLIYLEMVKCPKLTFFPCDEDGVWLNQASKLQDSTLGLTWSFLKRRTTKRLT